MEDGLINDNNTTHMPRNVTLGTLGDCRNIKTLSYQYRDHHDKDKTASRQSYFIMGIPVP